MIYRVKTTDAFDEETLLRVYSLLSEDQKKYIDRKPYEKRVQSLCVRATLAEMLGEEIVPFIEMNDSGRLMRLPDRRFISFSHSGKFVASACSDSPVGIDIQIFKPVSDKTINRVCTNDEVDYVQKNGAKSFFDIWTLKEAFVKCFGVSFAKAKGISFITDGKINIKNCEYERVYSEEYCCSILVSDKGAD